MAGFAKDEAEIAERLSKFLKGQIQDAKLTYGDLAERLEKHGHPHESAESIKQKLKRGTFPATFFWATVAALGMESVAVKDIKKR